MLPQKTASAGTVGATRLTFELDSERLDVSLSRWGEGLKDWRPFWRQYFAPTFYDRIERNFDLQGQLAEPGTGWTPLSERYARWKARNYPGKTILRRTDELYESLVWNAVTERPGPQGVFDAQKDALVVGTAVPHAKYHQKGGDRSFRVSSAGTGVRRTFSRRVVPMRRFLFLQKGMSQTMGRLMHRFAVETAVRAGMQAAVAQARSTGGGLL